MSETAEPVEYDNEIQVRDLLRDGRRLSLKIAAARLRIQIQKADLRALTKPFQEGSTGHAVPEISEILDRAEPYRRPLPE